jgi:hypothetical protein
MIDKDMIFLQNSTIVKKELRGPFGEMYLAFCDADQAMNIKSEKVSDTEEEEDPMPVTFLEIKADPEVSCMSLYAHC